jgi:transcriptional regulator with XRE-family HTH domain
MNIKAKRIEKGISLTRLSELTEIDKGDLSKIENEKGNPTIKTLKKIADKLGCELIILLK